MKIDYREILSRCEERAYLISMTPLEQLVRIGYEAGMCAGSAVLDLCCGYGEMLKIWHEAFGAKGVGVDICEEFIEAGRARLQAAGITGITLKLGDVRKLESAQRYDFVSCTEIFGSFGQTVDLLAGHLKPGGKLLMSSRYSKTEQPSRELVDFEGETLSLSQINAVFRSRGFYLTAMASCGDNEWERYIMWSARRHLATLRKNLGTAAHAWCDTWYDTYFGFRRAYEGFATFVAEREKEVLHD